MKRYFRFDILVITALIGIFLWTLDSVLDYYLFYSGTFPDLFLLDVPPHEIYIRSLWFGGVLVFGLISSAIINQREQAREHAQYMESLLRSIRNVNQTIVQTEGFREMLQETCTILAANPGYEKCVIIQLKEPEGAIESIIQSGGRSLGQIERATLPSCIERALETGRIQRVKGGNSCKLGDELQMEHALIVPIISDYGRLGAICLSVTEDKEIDPEEERLLDEVASDLAFAREKLRIEEKLRKSESEYRHLFENAPVGIFQTSSEGEIISLNPEMARMLGADSPREVLKEIQDLSRDFYLDPQRREDFITQLKEKGSLENFEFKGEKLDGEQVWIRLQARISKQFTDDRFLIDGFASDITNHKEMEQKLKRSQERLSRAQSFAGVGTWESDLDSDELYWSPECERIFGLEEGQFEGTHEGFLKRVHPDDREEVAQRVEPIIEKGKAVPLHYEHRIVTERGEVKWVRESAGIVEDETGEPSRVIGLIMDITDQVEAQKELKESEERYRTVFENTGTAMFIEDQNEIIAEVNEEFERLTGYTSDDVIGKMHPREIVAHKDQERVSRHHDLRYQDQDKAPNSYQFTLLDAEGEEKEVWVNVARLTGKNKQVVSLMDITEQIEAKRALEQSFVELAETTSRVLGIRDPYTREHEQRVAELARKVGERIGLDKDRLLGLYLGGLLHDIGKIAVPETVLTKPGKLTDIEWDLIESHPKVGYQEILEDTHFPWPVAEMALHHHERLDGSGYPDGLKGEKLSTEVRILGAVDVVEAMSSRRPYRSAKSKKEVLETLQESRGTKFDPEVVDVLLEMIKEGEITFD
mgnify:CR=1 FL=1